MNNDLFSTRAKPELKTWYYHALLSVIIFTANILLQNEEVCGNTIYSSSEASGVNHIIHRSLRLQYSYI